VKPWQLPLTLALLLAAADLGPSATAQGPPFIDAPVTAPDGVGGPPMEGGCAPSATPAGLEAAPRGGPLRRRLHGHFQRHGLGCWATHESVGCGSCQAERTFIFGSCREFFGEPCLQGPPPLPPGVSYGPRRCSCP